MQWDVGSELKVDVDTVRMDDVFMELMFHFLFSPLLGEMIQFD